jgi:hypothetical protein
MEQAAVIGTAVADSESYQAKDVGAAVEDRESP